MYTYTLNILIRKYNTGRTMRMKKSSLKNKILLCAYCDTKIFYFCPFYEYNSGSHCVERNNVRRAKH